MAAQSIAQSLVVLDDITIRRDSEGRFCLNDLHRAAGDIEKDKPGNWLRLDETQRLITTLDEEVKIAQNPAIKSKQGLGTFACLELVYDYAAWISPEFKLKVYRTFHSVVSGQAMVSEPTTAIPAAAEFQALFNVARLIGLDTNVAAISANQGVIQLTGTNVLALLGQTHLPAEQQILWFTPTELGKNIDVSARQLNLLLAEAGLQHNEDGRWVPSTKAEGLFRIFDTGKRHNSGTPVQQVKWAKEVVDHLKPLPLVA